MNISSNSQLRTILTKSHPNENLLSLPVVKSVVINIGTGSVKDEKESVEKIIELLTTISGQKPVPTKAKKAISVFKTRKGNIIGYKVTLRGKRAYDFINKLFHFSLPRIRDFRGLREQIINRGTVNIGLKESSVLPENSKNDADFSYGLQISITLTTTDAKNTREAIEILGAKFKS